MKLKGLPQRAYNILFHTHTVAGIVISFALFIIFYAGSFAIFRHEIFRWENPNARIEVVQDVNLQLALSVVKENNQNFAEEEQFTFRLPSEQMPFIQFFGAEYTDDTKESTQRFKALINPVNEYEYTNLNNPQTTLADTIYHLHYFEQIPFGLYISGLVSLFFLFASITGLLIHWRNLLTKFYAFTLGGKWKQIWTNAHTVLGVIGLPFQIVYAVTGALFGLLTLLLVPSAFVLFGGDTDKVLATVRPDRAIQVDKDALHTEHASLDQYLQKAENTFSDFDIAILSCRNYGREDGLVTFNLDDESTINGTGQITYALKSGEVKSQINPSDKTYTHSVLNTVTKLHFATFGGLGLKIIYFILGMITCFMILSGVLIWQEARNNNRYTDKQKRFHHRVTKIYLSICLALFPATALIFIANKIIPIAVAGRTSYVNAIFFLGWLALTIIGLFWNDFKKLNKNYLMIGGILSLLIPIANGLATGDWIWNAIRSHAWYVLSVDIFWLMTGLGAFLIVYFISPSKDNIHSTQQSHKDEVIDNKKVEKSLVLKFLNKD